MSEDQFEEAKEANQKWKYSNERTSESWREVEATAMESSLQKIDRVQSWERRCSSTTCSFWLACLFLSNPTRFSPTNQLKSFEPAINKQEFLPFCMKEWLDCCMDVCLSYKHDIGLERLSYQSKINYFYQHQNITIETCSISEIAIIILSLKFIFEAAAPFSLTCFSHLAA